MDCTYSYRIGLLTFLTAYGLALKIVDRSNIRQTCFGLFLPPLPTSTMPPTRKRFATTQLGMTVKGARSRFSRQAVELNNAENERPRKRVRRREVVGVNLTAERKHAGADFSGEIVPATPEKAANNVDSASSEPDMGLERGKNSIPACDVQPDVSNHGSLKRSNRSTSRVTRSMKRKEKQNYAYGSRQEGGSGSKQGEPGSTADSLKSRGQSNKTRSTDGSGDLLPQDMRRTRAVIPAAAGDPSSDCVSPVSRQQRQLHIPRRHPSRRGSGKGGNTAANVSQPTTTDIGKTRATTSNCTALMKITSNGREVNNHGHDNSAVHGRTPVTTVAQVGTRPVTPSPSNNTMKGLHDRYIEKGPLTGAVSQEQDGCVVPVLRPVRQHSSRAKKRSPITPEIQDIMNGDRIHNSPCPEQRRHPLRRATSRRIDEGRSLFMSSSESVEKDSDGDSETIEVELIEEPSISDSDHEGDAVRPFNTLKLKGSMGFAKETRKYNYVNRIKAAPRPSSDLVKRRSATAKEVVDFSTLVCCKKLKCFRNVNMDYFRAQRINLLKASQSERKQALSDMLQGDRKFHFNHRVVCTYFLSWGFGFSKDLQRTVKGTARAPATQLPHRTPRMNCKSDQRDFILSFLQSIATSTAEHMPDTSEQHLPFHQKKHVYDLFCESVTKFPLLGVTREPPSFSYFVKTWNEQMSNLKVRAVKRFTKCTECESTRMALVAAVKDRAETEGILEIRKRHLQFVQRERASYVTRSQMAVTNPMSVCSVVVDGADQSSFGLPHFTSSTKDTRGEALKVKLVGLLEHGSTKALFLYTMTGQFETGANHVVECIHRWLNKKASVQALPPVLFVQLDNCSRENKNRFLFAYLECLVAWGVFEEVQASFLPVGHTHSDIDQTFSCTSKRLKVNDAVTMSDLHEQLRKSYTPTPSVSSLLHVANFSGLLLTSTCLETVPPFSHYRFFKFSRRGGKPRDGTGRYNTTCTVKELCDGEWEYLSKKCNNGFLQFAPDLSATPKTVLTSPDNGVKVTERIDSEEGRINDEEKVQALRDLRDDVYRCREVQFGWNLETSIEARAARGEVMGSLGSEEPNATLQAPQTRLSYDLNSFVIVRPLPRTIECPFWLAQVLEQHRNADGIVSTISIRWYEVKGNQTVFDGRYTPSFRDDTQSRSVPWIAKISTDTVMFNFASLTYHNNIGRTLVRRIQSALQSQP